MEQPPVQFDNVLARIRAFSAARGWPPGRLAREAGLSDTVTRGMESETWSPTGTSVRALERLIPADWKPGDPLPSTGEEAAA